MALAQWLERARLRWKAARTGQPYISYVISLDDFGVDLKWRSVDGIKQGHWFCDWQTIVRVEVFKRDLYAVDLICIAFITSDETWYECNEEMNGWDELVESLPKHLPGCQGSSEWWHPVAVPAFRPNLRVIFSRGAS